MAQHIRGVHICGSLGKNFAEKCDKRRSEMFNRRRKKSVPQKRFEKMASAEVVAGDVG